MTPRRWAKIPRTMRRAATTIRAIRRETSDDRGAIIIIMAVIMVALLGMTAIVFDLGLKREQRRELVTATDAGALAAAGTFALGGDGCAVAADYVTGTDPGAVLATGWCTHVGSDSYGVVTVTADQPLDYTFAPVLGVDEGSTHALTMAAYGVPSEITGGLRPFGLCIDAMAGFETWSLPLNGPTGKLIVPYGKDDQPEGCNGDADIPGNWGLLDFDGGGNSRNDQRDWIEYGYDGPVSKGTPGALCTDPGEDKHCRDGDPGAWSNSVGTELEYLVDNEIEFTLPIFDSGGANGNNAYFHIVGFVTARLWDYKEDGPADERFLEIEFKPGLAQGTLGDGTGLDTGTRVIAICGVEAGNTC